MIRGKKKCIGLIFGGNSNEHEVSISSAKTVFQAFNSEINKERYTVKTFYINKYGDWLDSQLSEKILIGGIENNKANKQEISNQKKINFLDGIEFQNVDVWFPLLHGFNGEDGSIHGLLRFTKKPLVGDTQANKLFFGYFFLRINLFKIIPNIMMIIEPTIMGFKR